VPRLSAYFPIGEPFSENCSIPSFDLDKLDAGSRSQLRHISLPLEHLPPPALLRVRRIQNFVPRCRPGRVGTEPVLGDDAFAVTLADGSEEIHASALDVIGVKERSFRLARMRRRSLRFRSVSGNPRRSSPS